MTGQGPPAAEAGQNARRQLGRVLSALALLDTAVLVAVVLLAIARQSFRLTASEFLGLVLVLVGTILAVRVALAVRLRSRSGNLS